MLRSSAQVSRLSVGPRTPTPFCISWKGVKGKEKVASSLSDATNVRDALFVGRKRARMSGTGSLMRVILMGSRTFRTHSRVLE